MLAVSVGHRICCREAAAAGNANPEQQRIVDAIKEGGERGRETVAAAWEADAAGNANPKQQRIVGAMKEGGERGGERGRKTIAAAQEADATGNANPEQQRIVDAIKEGGERGCERGRETIASNKKAAGTDWESRHRQLVAYKERNGHVDVPWNDGPLGTWVSTQRTQLRLRNEDKKSRMTDERKAKLYELGFNGRVTRTRTRTKTKTRRQRAGGRVKSL